MYGNEQGLVAYWNTEEGRGQILHDKANRHSAILGSTVQSETFDPFWIQGSCLAACGIVLTDFQADKNIIYDGQQVSFLNSSLGATNYEWRINDSQVLSTDMDITAYMTKGTHIVELRAINSNTGEDNYQSEVYSIDEYIGAPNIPQANTAHHCSINQSKGIPIEGCENMSLEPTNSIQASVTAISNCIGYIPPNPITATAAYNFKTTSVYKAGGFRLIFQDLESCTGLGFNDATPINPNSPCFSTASTLGEARINTAIAVFEYISDLLSITPTSAFSIHANQAATIAANPTFEIYFEASTIGQGFLGGATPYYHPTSQGGFQGGFIQEMFTTFGNPGGINGITDPDIQRADARIIMNFGNIILNSNVYQFNSCHLATSCDLVGGAAASAEFDLYTTILHEIMHAMGFASAINLFTSSRLQSGDYTLFDKMLLDDRSQNIGNHILDLSASYVGTPTNIVSNNMGYYNHTNIGTALSIYNLNYNTLVYPVYSPPVWTDASSLSHFENGVGSCNINNYVMNPGLFPCTERRELTLPEKEVFSDLGYILPFQGNFPTGNADYATTTLGTTVCIPVLNNDNNQTSLSICGGVAGITPLIGGNMFSITTGPTGLQEICFTPDPSFIGIAQFQYCITDGNLEGACPIDVFVEVTSDYCPDDPCNFICNGGFELGIDPCAIPISFNGTVYLHPNAPPSGTSIHPSNGWFSTSLGTPDLFIRESTVNCIPNFWSFFPQSNNYYPNTYIPNDPNNNRYVNAAVSSNYIEGLFTKLAKPLIAGKSYKLSFWIRSEVPINKPNLNLIIHIHDDPVGTASIGYSPTYIPIVSLGGGNAYFALSTLPFDIIANSTNISSNINPGTNHNHEYVGAAHQWEFVTIEFTAPPLNPNSHYFVIEPVPNSNYLPSNAYFNYFDDFRLEEVNTIPLAVGTTVSYNSGTNQATYSIEICNNSKVGITATNIAINHFLPPGLTLAAGNPGWTTLPNGSLEYTIPNLSPLSCTTITVIADIPINTPPNTNLTGCSFATSNNGGDDCISITNGDNCATFQIPGTDIAINKTASVSNLKPGDPITFTITISNLGPNDATNVIVNDILDPNLLTPTSSISPTGLGASYIGGVLTIPNLGVNQQVTLTINATVNSAFPNNGNGQIINCAEFDPSLMLEQDIFITNNTSCVSVDVGCGLLQGYVIIPDNVTTISGAIAAGLLPMPLAETQAQQVIIQSVLTVDLGITGGPYYSFAPGSEILIIPNINSPNALAGFDVPQEAKLRIIGSHLHGCLNMWRGIHVLEQGELEIIGNSLIEDAEYAVHVENKSSWNLFSSIFRNNYVSIFAADNGVLKNFSYFISGITFEGTGTLLDNYPGQLTAPDTWPYAGIELHDVLTFSTAKKAPSTFHDLANGILLFNTGARLSQSVEIFDLHLVNSYTLPNHILPSFSGIGIYSENNTGATIGFTLHGFGNLPSSTFTVRNSLFGVLVKGKIRFDIQQNNFENFAINSILCMGADGVEGLVINNRINLQTGGVNAIWMWQNDPMKALKIIGNEILVDKSGSLFTPDGILIDENNLPYRLEISNNIINMREGQRALNLRNHQGLFSLNSSIGNNDINFTNTTPGAYVGFPNRTGISSSNGQNQYIHCNTVDGDNNLSAINVSPLIPSFPPSNNNNNVFGIRSNQSSNLILNCNQFNLIPNGIQISANSNVPTLLQGNRFGRVGRGIWLANGAQIGNQIDNGNRWVYPNLPTALQNPNNPIAQAWNIVGAQNDNYTSGFADFEYDPSGINYIPFSILTTPISNTWFSQQQTLPTITFDCNNPSNPTCPVPVPLVANPFVALSGSDQAVVAGTFGSPVFPQTSIFESNSRTYSKFKQHPGLAPTGSAEAIFVNNLDQRCEGEFYTVEQRCHVLKRIPISIQNQVQNLQQSMDILLQDIYYLDSLWAEDSLDRDSLSLLINQKGQQIQPLMAQLQQLKMQTEQNQLAVATSTGAINTGITTNQLAELNLKVVNEIYLKTIGQRIYYFTAQQEQDLHQIALQCPLDGGIAVYKARSMVGLYTKIDYELLQNCQPSINPLPRLIQEEEVNVTKTANIQLYPNPTTASITLEWHLDSGEKGQLFLFNALGQMIRQENIQGKEGQKQIALNRFAPGIYFCKLYFEGKEIYQEKIIFIE